MALSRKAEIAITGMDMIGVIFWLIAVVIAIILFTIFHQSTTYRIQEKTIDLDDTNQLMTLLRTPIDSASTDAPTTVADLIVLRSVGIMDSRLETTLDDVLAKVYSRPVCWIITVDEGTQISGECDGSVESKKLFDATTILPQAYHPGLQSLSVHMKVIGYSQYSQSSAQDATGEAQ